ncbi:MAG: rhomboid family intramembrane serine protease [Actinomycetota bacterium]|nr:rhomboid family intramembrane serine protease [Actinomycetota bacterium]
MTAPTPVRPPDTQATGPATFPTLTATVFAVTLTVSVAALFIPDLMALFTRDLAKVRQGQWWRVVTPLLVQSSGWGQLVFNLAGLAVVGAVVERRVSRTTWALIYLVGGVGSIGLGSAWHPAATGGGSSDAIAALIGAIAVLVVVDGRPSGHDWPAQVYSIFFVTYLTALALAGVVPSIVVGDASMIILFTARRAMNPTTLARACLIVVAAGGALMSLAQDGHGTGMVAGIAIAAIVVAHRRLPTANRLQRR